MSFFFNRYGNMCGLHFMWHKVAIVAFLLVLAGVTPTFSAVKTWTNGASTGLWNSANNWQPSGAPTSSDTVVFDGTSSANCTLNTSVTIQALFIDNTYSGVFDMSSQTLTLTHALTINGSSSFNANTGTIIIASAVGLFDLMSTQDLYNLEIASGNTVRYNLSVSNDLTVLHDFTLTQINNLGCGFFCNKRIAVYGNATFNDADGWSATGRVAMVGSANQQVLGNGIATQFIVDKTGGTVSLSSFTGSFGLVSGGYCRLASTNQGTLNIGGITVDAFVYDIQGGTLAGSGTLNGNVTCSSTGVLSPGGNTVGCITINGDLTMQSGSTLRVDVQGTVACTQFDQVVVVGAVTLDNSTITGGTTFQTIAPVTIIDNDDTDGISGTFNGITNGGLVTLSGKSYAVNYDGDSGNDVILTTNNLAPVAQCAWIDHGIASECLPYNITASMANDGSYDPEGGPVTLSVNTTGPFGSNLWLVDLTVTDTLGASSMCQAIVNVYDTLAATITTPCPNTIVVCGEQSVTWTEPEALDAGNCFVTRYRSSSATNGAEAPGDVFPVGVNDILYQWEGGGYPTAYCIMTIVVLPLPDVSISQTQLTGACQGAKLLTADIANAGSLQAPIQYNWTGTATGTTQSIAATQNGTYTVTVTDGGGCTATANVTLTVDNTDPVPSVPTLSDITAECGVTITTAPTATDNCAGVITGTTSNPLTYSAQGSYTITWTYDDGNGNVVTQDQDVVIQDVTAPVPTVSNLSTLTGECSVTVATAPTATDNCAGTITGTTSDPLTYTAQGTYTITWLYNDGHGNTTTQTQTVVVDDITAPVPNVSSLPAIKAQCGITVSSFPTATDNCVGTLTATTNSPLTYSVQGTYSILWKYNDGNGNSVTQTQAVIIQDTIAPVPNVAVLSTVTAQCSATVTAVPTATDNCRGVIQATTASPLTFTAQGTHTITWVYNDGNGNTTTQTQTVVINDNTPPTITTPCPSNITVCSGQNITWTEPQATDNCSAVTRTRSHVPGSTFANGTTTVTYTFTDAKGNSTSCNFTVTVGGGVNVSIAATALPDFCQGAARLTASVTNPIQNATYSYSWSGGAGNTSSITALTNGTYTVTVTSNSGCSGTATYTVNNTISGLLSGYVLLANQGIHMHRSRVQGNIGVRYANKKAKVHEHSVVTGFAKAATIQVNGNSSVGQQISGQVSVTLPTFISNTNNSNNNVTVNQNQTVTLSGTNYGKIKIKHHATVTFTAAQINIKEIEADENATINFSQDATVLVKNGVSLEEDNNVNSAGKRVVFYVGDEFEIEGGSSFKGNVYAQDDIEAKGHKSGDWDWDDDDNHGSCGGGSTSGDSTHMVGMFISAKQIKSGKYVSWKNGAACTPSSGFSAKAIAESTIETDEDAPAGSPVVEVYPNPASNNINVVLNGMGKVEKTIRITDVLGKTIFTTSADASTTEININLLNASIQNGMYILHVETQTGRYNTQFVVVQ